MQENLIDRRDLVAALDRAARKQVTIVSAPAGSGKTSLLRAWTQSAGRDRRIAFVSVRPGQQDAQQFWLTVLGAVRDGDAGSPPATPGFNGRAMVDRVLAEITAAGRPVVLVIDDLHELRSAEAVDQLTALLLGLPANARAIVATRHDLPLHLHQLRLAGELTEIRDAQLRFTIADTRALLAAAGISLPGSAVDLLHQRTEGWAAGLRLAVLSLVGNPDPERFVAEFSGSNRTVAEYLLAEMLDRQPAPVQRLLLRTSILDRVNGELGDLLTGSSGSERILLDLEDANAFVVSLDPDRAWFRYHHLFRDLLRLELRRASAPDIPQLHRLAAQWFTEHGEAVDAVRHLEAAADWTQAARLLTDHVLSLTLDGQAGMLPSMLRAFPPFFSDSPELALVRAVADLNELRLDQAGAHLDVARAYAATTATARQYRLRMAIVALDLLSARLRGHFDGVLELAGALPPAVAGMSDADVALAGDLRALSLLNLGVTQAWSLRLADSERSLTEGAAVARGIGRPYLEVACLAHLGFAATYRSLAQARRHCEDAVARAAEHGWDNEPVIAPALATLAGVLIWTGEFDHGEEWLDRARHATAAEGEPGVRLLTHLVGAMLPAARGQHREALAEFAAADQVQAEMTGEHALTSRVVGWTIATRARLGELAQARAALAAVGGRLAATGEIRTGAAVVRLAEGDPAAARRELRPVLDGDAAVNPHLTLIEAHLLDALACRALGDAAGRRAAVERALDLAEPNQLILPFAMTGAAELLTALPPHGTAHAALVIAILDALHTGGPNRAASGPVEELSPTELRVLRYLPTNLTRHEIAGELSVSLNTVSTHIRRIYVKLGATDRSSAVRRGRELRLLSGRG